ncbi:hypothetical protein GF420_11875 [candidate division GN15 bacterium]|jgi:hypothetical protein|nr:hypothetical protein [candidate division GN15 bacterium]
MKVNPAGIQNYQHLTRRDTEANANVRRADEQAARTDVDIKPQQSVGSKLAVKGPSGTYAEYLSDSERKAMEMLFARFQETGRFTGGKADAQQSLGRLVDVKV